MPLGAGLGIAGIAGAGAQIWGAQTAANAQTQAAQQSLALQQKMFGISQGNLQPYIQAGTNATSLLSQLLGTTGTSGSGVTNSSGQALGGGLTNGLLTTPFNPTIQQLQSTPGYQFTLQQGTEAAQNANAAMGLAGSPAGGRGLINYASGLASNTYQQQYQNYWNQNQSIYNMLNGTASMGANAAGGLANVATNVGTNMGATTVGAGNAQAAAANATGGAIAGAATGGTNQYLQYNLLQNMLANNGIYTPAQIANIGNMNAASATDAQANAYGQAMGLV